MSKTLDNESFDRSFAESSSYNEGDSSHRRLGEKIGRLSPLPAIQAFQTRYLPADMVNRRTGYCCNCNSNVVHVRAFESRIAWILDRLTLGILGLFRIGPWKCVDCGQGSLLISKSTEAIRSVSEKREVADESAAVGNFIKTDMSLAHAANNANRFSEKYRIGIVEKLMQGKSTVSRVCHELGVSELELQKWIKAWTEQEIRRQVELQAGRLIIADDSSSESFDSEDWSGERPGGLVIESKAVKKPR
ncbi:MAG: transposase [Pirellulaceae bacterium]